VGFAVVVAQRYQGGLAILMAVELLIRKMGLGGHLSAFVYYVQAVRSSGLEPVHCLVVLLLPERAVVGLGGVFAEAKAEAEESGCLVPEDGDDDGRGDDDDGGGAVVELAIVNSVEVAAPSGMGS